MTLFSSFCIHKIFRKLHLWPWTLGQGHWNSNLEIFSRCTYWCEFQNPTSPHYRIYTPPTRLLCAVTTIPHQPLTKLWRPGTTHQRLKDCGALHDVRSKFTDEGFKKKKKLPYSSTQFVSFLRSFTQSSTSPTLSSTTSLMIGRPSGLCILALMNWQRRRNSLSYRFLSSGFIGFHSSAQRTGNMQRHMIKGTLQ